MPPARMPALLRQVLTLPTAPFAESNVLAFVTEFCERLPNVTLSADRYGNLLARYRFRPTGVPVLAFTAHTDHPGFVALEMADRRTVRAAFRGWVEPEYFARQRVRFFSDGRWISGRISRITRSAKLYRMIGRTARPEEVLVTVQESVPAGAPGMWDLPDPELRDGLVHARGCDDLAGVAAMLALLERLTRRRRPAEVCCLFTRAEEVGFIGAIGAARERTLPRDMPVIAIETSKALPSAPLGAGPILRVGDRSSVFTPGLTAFCERVASDLAQRRKRFTWQRKLMDGGTCESTAYCVYGYAATGMCVALGNYHNMDTQRKRIASEYVSLSDWQGMVDWFEALVLDRQGYGGEDRRGGGENRPRAQPGFSALGAGAGGKVRGWKAQGGYGAPAGSTGGTLTSERNIQASPSPSLIAAYSTHA